MTTVIETIILERDAAGQLTGADIRFYRWLGQWLTEDEARRLVYSLAWERLTALTWRYHQEIMAMPCWQEDAR